MKRMIILGTIALAVLAAPALADMVQNASFETGISIPAGGFLELDAGSTAITDWTVVGAGVKVIDYIGGYWDASDGVRSLDLNGNPGPGGVQQVISTTPSNTYVVTFDMAGNPDGLPMIKTMDVSAIGSTTQTQSFSFDTTGMSKALMGWTTMQWTFVADATDTTLLFMSTLTDDSPYGPALDNVSVVPVPGAILLGILGLSVAGVKLRKFS